MSRPSNRPAGIELLLTQLANYRATRDRCREPQRSIFTALIKQLETKLADFEALAVATSAARFTEARKSSDHQIG